MTNENQRFIPFISKLIIAIVAFIGMFIISMAFGAADVTVKDVWQALTSNAVGEKISIIREIRFLVKWGQSLWVQPLPFPGPSCRE